MSPAPLCVKTSTQKPHKPCSHPTGREILENPNRTIFSLGKEMLLSHTRGSLKAWLFLRQKKANYDFRSFKKTVVSGLPPVTQNPGISSPTPCASPNQRFKLQSPRQKESESNNLWWIWQMPFALIFLQSELRSDGDIHKHQMGKKEKTQK